MLSSIITSIISFASTNIDDIFVLMLLYAQVDIKMKKKYIVIGQYLGIGILVVLSLLGAFGLHFVPQKYVGLLGVIPVTLGIKAWIDYKKEKLDSLQNHENDTEKEANIDAQLIHNRKHGKLWNIMMKAKTVITKVIKPEILSVMLITTANGADNIGIYTPLFTGYSVGQLIVVMFIFALMIALWCFVGDRLANFPVLKAEIQKYKHIVVPIVFVALGIYIILSKTV